EQGTGVHDDEVNGYPFNIGEDGTGIYNLGNELVINYDEFAVFKGEALTHEDIIAIYEYAPEGYEGAVWVDPNAPVTFESDPAAVAAKAELYLSFDDGIADTTGKYPLNVVGNVTSVEGVSGNGVLINTVGDGSDVSYIEIPDYKFGSESFTASIWFIRKSGYKDQVLFGNQDRSSDPTTTGWTIYTSYAKAAYRSAITGLDRGKADAEWAGTSLSDFNESWNQLTVVVDREAQVTTIYFNGKEAVASSFASVGHGEESYDLGNFIIGAYYDEARAAVTHSYAGSWSEDYELYVDEVALFKGCLTKDEVAALSAYKAPEATDDPTDPVDPDPVDPVDPVDPGVTDDPEVVDPGTDDPTDEPSAPQTFDIAIVAAVASIISLAGFAIAKKH
ncbi:MAG: LamG domain-containing protein, partial [Ruminococcaceae bacterium]|nr:LamG domain-containing protein [Oscillospiraceae bacterium]